MPDRSGHVGADVRDELRVEADRGVVLLDGVLDVLQATASEFEYSLPTTDPAELAAGDDDQTAAVVDLDTL